MKTHVKTGVLIFFLTILSVAGIQPGKAKADSIKIAGNMVLNEVKDVDIEGHHYEAILFRVSQNVANNETYAILQGLKSNENSLVIPAYIEGIPVKEITEIQDSTVQYGTKCFSHDDQGYYVWSENSSKKYDTITIPSTITRIEKFKNVKVKKIVVPETVEYFGGGSQLEQVQIKGKNTKIGSAFVYGSLNKITLPKGYQGTIEKNAFSGTQLTTFRWPAYKKGLKNKMGSYLFSDCKKLKKITFEAGTKQVYIPESCFEGCSKIKKLVFPKSLKKVIYGWHEYAGNYTSKAPKTLVFKGKSTKLQGVKIRKYLDIENADTGGKDLYDKYILTVGKIIAPKKSQAVKCAKKIYTVKKIIRRKGQHSWRDDAGRGYKLAKVKWSYSK